ncbi:MAG TPA: LysR family transcriptional regulator [Acetobacteraceae bacterium]|nr:LysR family transcriptional regulator [Acetobacteraceae bacterium]
MDLLSAYRVFQRVAEAGSFSAVAREMGMTQPAVSRQISALEEELGARLIQRTTRHLTLTEDGRDLLAHTQRVLEAVEESLAAIGRRRDTPSGLVRLGALTSFGRLYIAPRLPRLLARYPELSVDLLLDDRRQDLIEEGLDVVIRAGEVADASLVARRVGSVAIVLIASTRYLQQRGEPQHPADLANHECIIFDRRAAPRDWHFEGPDGPVTVKVNGRFSTDSIEAVREMVLADFGIASTSAWLMRDAFEQGSVKRLLKPWRQARVPLHAVYPSRRHLAPRTRAVIDFLVEEFRLDPVISTYGEA